MPHSRQQPKIAATGRIRVRLTTEQRDLLIHAKKTPAALGHLLHRTPVKDGKLNVRLARDELDAVIASAASIAPVDKRTDRTIAALLDYLENLEDRFEDERDDRGEWDNVS